jgi:hypothetical protein
MRWKSLLGFSVVVAIIVAATIGAVSCVTNEFVAFPASIRATEENCSSGASGYCSWTGDFTSNNGRFHFKHVDLSGGGWSVGKQTDALYEGRSLFGVLIYHAHGSHQWIEDALVLLGASLIAIMCLIWPFLTITMWVTGHGKTSSTLGARHRATDDDASPNTMTT